MTQTRRGFLSLLGAAIVTPKLWLPGTNKTTFVLGTGLHVEKPQYEVHAFLYELSADAVAQIEDGKAVIGGWAQVVQAGEDWDNPGLDVQAYRAAVAKLVVT